MISAGYTGVASLLLDIIPAAALILLAAAFFRGRAERKKEEKDLKEAIRAFSEKDTEEDAEAS